MQSYCDDAVWSGTLPNTGSTIVRAIYVPVSSQVASDKKATFTYWGNSDKPVIENRPRAMFKQRTVNGNSVRDECFRATSKKTGSLSENVLFEHKITLKNIHNI